MNMCTERPSTEQRMNWMYVHVKDTVSEGKRGWGGGGGGGGARGERKRQRITQRLTFFMI